MKILFATTALLEAGTGIVLIAAPSFLARVLLGVPLDAPGAASVAGIAGSGLLAIALACWLARDDGASRAGRAVLAGITLYNVAAAVVLALAALAMHLHGIGLWPAAALHIAMAAWCISEGLNRR